MNGIPDYFLSDHAREAARKRDIPWSDITDVVEHSEVRFGPDSEGRTVHQKDDLAVVTGKDGGVVTVLLRHENQWTDEDARNRRKDPEDSEESKNRECIATTLTFCPGEFLSGVASLSTRCGGCGIRLRYHILEKLRFIWEVDGINRITGSPARLIVNTKSAERPAITTKFHSTHPNYRLGETIAYKGIQ